MLKRILGRRILLCAPKRVHRELPCPLTLPSGIGTDGEAGVLIHTRVRTVHKTTLRFRIRTRFYAALVGAATCKGKVAHLLSSCFCYVCSVGGKSAKGLLGLELGAFFPFDNALAGSSAVQKTGENKLALAIGSLSTLWECLQRHRQDDVCVDASAAGKDVYDIAKEAGRLKETKRTDGVSTSDLLMRVTKDHVLRGYTRKELGVSFVKVVNQEEEKASRLSFSW